MDFCNAFNAETQNAEKGMPLPVVITVYEDKSFDFIIKTTPASVLIKKAAGIKSGSGTPNSVKVGKVTRAQLEEIAKIKDPDLTAADMDAAVRTLSGSARSAGRSLSRSSKTQLAAAEACRCNTCHEQWLTAGYGGV